MQVILAIIKFILSLLSAKKPAAPAEPLKPEPSAVIPVTPKPEPAPLPVTPVTPVTPVPSQVASSIQQYASYQTLCYGLVTYSEGCRLRAYPDPISGGDPWTIGFGATGPGIHAGVVWTQAQADARCMADIAERGAIVNQYVTVPLNAGQKAALVSIIYNVGVGGKGRSGIIWLSDGKTHSTLLRCLNAGDYAGAANQFLVWDKAGGRTVPGLVGRRKAEQSLFLTGTWKKWRGD